MTFEEVQKFIARNITYKPGWEFAIKRKKTKGKEVDAFYLQIQFDAADNFSGKVERQYCRKWLLSEWMTPTEIVRTAWLAVQQAEKHEMEETFRLNGRDIFNSHIDVAGLCDLCDGNVYEHRKPTREAIDKMCDDASLAVSKMSQAEKDNLRRAAELIMEKGVPPQKVRADKISLELAAKVMNGEI